MQSLICTEQDRDTVILLTRGAQDLLASHSRSAAAAAFRFAALMIVQQILQHNTCVLPQTP